MDWLNESVIDAVGLSLSKAKSVTEECAFFTVSGGQSAISIWTQLSASATKLGGWPILCGDAKDFDRVEEMLEISEDSLSALLVAVPSGPPVDSQLAEQAEQRIAMLEFVKQSNPSLYEIMRANAEQEKPSEVSVDFSTWPSEPSSALRRPLVAFDFQGNPHKECVLAVCRTQDPCESPAYLRFGAYNDCPSSSIHVAYLRDWNKRFGAVPFGITSDVIELFLPTPSVDRDIALSVAIEQYRYCPDIVDQGTQTVENLAKEIWGSSFWYFWWD